MGQNKGGNKYNQSNIQFTKKRRARMDLEKIVSILIHLLEDQEGVKIIYEIIPVNKENEKKTSQNIESEEEREKEKDTGAKDTFCYG